MQDIDYIDNIFDDLEDVDFIENIEANVEPQIHVPRQVYVRNNFFETYTEIEFHRRFRVSKDTALFILDLIENRLEYVDDRNNSLSPINQLLLTLRLYATGAHQLQIGDYMQCDHSTVCRIFKKVTNAIASLHQEYIYLPRNEMEIAATQNAFYDLKKFPGVIGAVDGTHIRINSPGGNRAEIYRNRKGYFSINVQIIANANYEILNITSRHPGSSHDSHIYRISVANQRFERREFGNAILLGDSAYGNNAYTFTPLLNVTNRAEENYNISHKRSRVVVENTIGIWKRRFPILAYGCRHKLSNVWAIPVATAVLHNIARRRGEAEPPIENEVREHDLQVALARGDIPLPPNQLIRQNFDHRRILIDNYFANIRF